MKLLSQTTRNFVSQQMTDAGDEREPNEEREKQIKTTLTTLTLICVRNLCQSS